MSVCAFFNHKDCPKTKYTDIVNLIKSLILKKKVSIFYVGSQGDFDLLVYRALCCLRQDFTHIYIYRVLAYIPKKSYYL